MKRRVAASLVAALAGPPLDAYAKPPRPSIHKQAQAAKKACAPYAEHIRRAEKAKKLPRHTLTALGFTESGCDPKAENRKTRARGWGQFVPSGAAAVGRIQRARGETPWFSYKRALDPVASIRAAAELVAWGLETCGSLVEAIGAYNTGRCTSNGFSRGVLRLAELLRFVAGAEPRNHDPRFPGEACCENSSHPEQRNDATRENDDALLTFRGSRQEGIGETWQRVRSGRS